MWYSCMQRSTRSMRCSAQAMAQVADQVAEKAVPTAQKITNVAQEQTHKASDELFTTLCRLPPWGSARPRPGMPILVLLTCMLYQVARLCMFARPFHPCYSLAGSSLPCLLSELLLLLSIHCLEPLPA